MKYFAGEDIANQISVGVTAVVEEVKEENANPLLWLIIVPVIFVIAGMVSLVKFGLYVTIGLVGIIVMIILYYFDAEKKKNDGLRYQQALINEYHKYALRFTEASTKSARLNNAKKALGTLEVMSDVGYPPEVKREIIRESEIWKSIIKVIPLETPLNRADKYHFSGNDNGELKAIKEAVYEIIENEIDDSDIVLSGIGADLEEIKGRASDLGWEAPFDVSPQTLKVVK